MSGGILFSEENIISHRTASVTESQNLVGFVLHPAKRMSELAPRVSWRVVAATKTSDMDFVWVYRRLLSANDERALERGPRCVAQKVKALLFNTDPQFTVRWADSGESVALFINRVPWAFIDGINHSRYSKGLIDTHFGKQWNQVLFESVFEEN
jgi:hypothetical protein